MGVRAILGKKGKLNKNTMERKGGGREGGRKGKREGSERKTKERWMMGREKKKRDGERRCT